MIIIYFARLSFTDYFQESGVVILRSSTGLEDEDEGVDDEVESDSDSGLGGSVPPCSVIFVGANVSTGKSSMRMAKTSGREKKVGPSLMTSRKILLLLWMWEDLMEG